MALAAAGAAFIIAACVAARTASATRPEMSSEELRVSAGPAANDQDLGGDDVLHATQATAPQHFLYAIGDSHGDKNYLVRSLLATGLFNLKGKELQWKPEAPDPKKVASREVVILGDFVDRGTYSKDNALLLKTLQADATKLATIKFTVLMGNHESMLLRYLGGGHDYAGKDTREDSVHRKMDWSAEERDAALKATSGEDFLLITWIRQLPVVHLAHGVLLMHGGLSKAVKDLIRGDVAACTKKMVKDKKKERKVDTSQGPACGDAAMKYINEKANKYYAAMHACAQKEGATHQSCNKENELPYVIGLYDDKNPFTTGGVLWYRGYSNTEGGAGTEAAGDVADEVADQFGAYVMVVAHSTHERITKYQNKNRVPVYAVDTHFTDCYRSGECDFGTTEAHQFHTGDNIDTHKTNVPQALRLEGTEPQQAGGSWVYIDNRCLSKVGKEGVVKVECTTVPKA